jgi:hypothetical protein
MLQSRHLRSLALTCSLFIGVLIFHHLGGGDIGFTPLLAPLLLGSLLFFSYKPLVAFEGPGLALVIVLFQGLGHFTVASGAMKSDTKMLISHIFAAGITYFLARRLDLVASAYDAIINAIVPLLTSWVLSAPQALNLLIGSSPVEQIKNEFKYLILGRAPPFIVSA